MGCRGSRLLWIVGGASTALGCGGLDDRSPGLVAQPAARRPAPGPGQDDDGARETSRPGGGDAPSPSDTPTERPSGDAGGELASGMNGSAAEGTAGAIGLASSRLDFGVVGLGQTEERLLEIANRSSDSIALSAAVQAQNGGVPGFELGLGCNERLRAGAVCELPVRFSPAAIGLWENTLLLVTDRDEMASIELVGEARALPRLVSDESRFAFEPLPVGMAATHRWVVTNDGGLATNTVAVRFFSTGLDAIDFSLAYDCAGGLPPGASCNVDVTFSPTKLSGQRGRVNLSAASGVTGVAPYEIELIVQGEGL